MSKGARESWLFDEAHPPLAEIDAAIAAHYLADETTTVRALVARAGLDPVQDARVQASARELVVAIRSRRRQTSGVDALLGEYDLSSREGIALMCLAEALLRIPDAATRDALMRDKLGGGDWQRAPRRTADSLFVNAATWGLMLTGRLVATRQQRGASAGALARLVGRGGEPVIREGVRPGDAAHGRSSS